VQATIAYKFLHAVESQDTISGASIGQDRCLCIGVDEICLLSTTFPPSNAESDRRTGGTSCFHARLCCFAFLHHPPLLVDHPFSETVPFSVVD
jgi:hypothetical protein